MDLGDYLSEPESVRASATGCAGEYGDESRTLVCTASSLVYVVGGDVIDISRKMICALEYEETSVDRGSLAVGIGAVVLGVLGFGADGLLEDLAPILEILGVVAVLFGAFAIGLSFYYRRSTLEVHVPSKSFTFTSKGPDLGEVARAVRPDGGS